LNRRTFLGLLSLVGCKEEDMNINKKMWFLSGQSTPPTPYFDGITEFIFTGDSIADGSNATAGNSYAELLVTEYAATYAQASQNTAVGGSGVWEECDGLRTVAFTRASTAFFFEGGLNDLRRNSTTQCYNKLESCLKSLIRRAWLDGTKIVAGGDATVTRVGTFAAFAADTFGGVYNLGAVPGPRATSHSTANATWTWTFTGNNVFVQFSSSYPSIARGDCEIRIDGNLVDTITDFSDRYDGTSDGTYNNQRGPDTRFYSGLTSASHSIEIKGLSTTPIVVDQIGVLLDPADCGVILVLEIPYITDYAKPGLDQADDTIIDTGNGIRENVVDYFAALGYRISFVPINLANGGLYDLANIDSDGVHPTNAGHLQIKNSIKPFIDL